MRYLAILLCVALGACSTAGARPGSATGSAAGVTEDSQRQRLAAVAARIAQGASEFCPESSAYRSASKDAGLAICGYPIRISSQRKVHASTNGARIRITRGMLEFLSTDEQLAFVLAHELSHNLLGHSGAVRGSAIKAVEAEADYWGILLVARAGYDLDAAALFLPRLAEAFPSIAAPRASYHTPATRLAAIRRTIIEIRARQARGKAVIPSGLDRILPRQPASDSHPPLRRPDRNRL